MKRLPLYQELFNINEKGRGMPVQYRIGLPIPELKEKQKIAIFLLGPPASGKTTFIENIIKPINNNFKKINSDDINMLIQKWKEEGGKSNFIATFNPERKSSEKAYVYIVQLIKSGINFIYDTTGMNFEISIKLANIARDNGYKCVFIHILVDLKTALERNTIRNKKNIQPPVNDKYIIASHKEVVSIIKQYIKNINWSTDSYYTVTTKDFELAFYKITKSETILKYYNRSYIDTGMSLLDFYKKLNEGLKYFYNQ